MSTWKAELSTVFEAPTPGFSILQHRQSVGPLALQKVLYPEGPGIAHGFLLHPPSGIAGGDTLSISARVKPNAHALLTTPGAARWYKANGETASQDVEILVEDAGCLEWLPSENIFFDACQARLRSEIRLAASARFIGWEVLQFGQQRSLQSTAHSWSEGSARLDTSVMVDGCLDWKELAEFTTGSVYECPSILGMGGFSVHGTLWAYCGRPMPDLDRDICQQQTRFLPELRSGFTQFPSGLLVFRVLARDTETARKVLALVWATLRPWAVGRPAEPLRIWAT
jgi:urease accessory protein